MVAGSVFLREASREWGGATLAALRPSRGGASFRFARQGTKNREGRLFSRRPSRGIHLRASRCRSPAIPTCFVVARRPAVACRRRRTSSWSQGDRTTSGVSRRLPSCSIVARIRRDSGPVEASSRPGAFVRSLPGSCRRYLQLALDGSLAADPPHLSAGRAQEPHRDPAFPVAWRSRRRNILSVAARRSTRHDLSAVANSAHLVTVSPGRPSPHSVRECVAFARNAFDWLRDRLDVDLFCPASGSFEDARDAELQHPCHPSQPPAPSRVSQAARQG